MFTSGRFLTIGENTVVLFAEFEAVDGIAIGTLPSFLILDACTLLHC